MGQALSLQSAVLQVAHDGIKLRHGIADRRTGSKHDAPASGDLIHIAAFHKHVRRLLCLRSGKAGYVPHFCVKKQVFERMALVHEQAVNAQLLKGDYIVLLVRSQQLVQPCFQGFPGLFHLLDGKVFAPAVLELCDSVLNLFNLLPQKAFLPFR